MKPVNYQLRPDPIAAAITLALMLIALLIVGALAGCAGAPDVQVQRAWGTGGIELTWSGTPMFLEVEEAGIEMDDGELASCTSVVASIAGAVAEGVITEISDSRCVTEGGLLPFGIRRVMLVRGASTGAPSAQ